jgi:molybdopterin synthase sulfur carrier subunit
VAQTVRFFAAARAAAGRSEQPAQAPTLAALLDGLGAENDRLAAVLARCSFLVDGLAWHDRTAPLPPAATVDVLPPFAGG